MKKSIAERDKPRRIYVNEQIWREIKAECAKNGISISKWFREQAKNKTIILKAIVLISVITSGFLMYHSPEGEEIKSLIISLLSSK